MNPSRGDAVNVNTIWRQFRREPLDHADQRALGRGVIDMKGFASLSGRRTHEYDVATLPGLQGVLLLELCDRMPNQGEDTIEVDGDRSAPLGVGEFVDRGIFRRPDAVIRDQDIEASEAFNGLVH